MAGLVNHLAELSNDALRLAAYATGPRTERMPTWARKHWLPKQEGRIHPSSMSWWGWSVSGTGANRDRHTMTS